jgi:hypothetical protein
MYLDSYAMSSALMTNGSFKRIGRPEAGVTRDWSLIASC